MVYESKRNLGVKAKLLSEDTKYMTVMLEYITGDKVGSTFSITTSTLKSWWKKVKEEVVETVEKVEEKQVQEMPEAVEELIKDVDEEVEKACEELKVDSDTLKPKKEKKVKEPTKPLYDSYEVMQFLTSNGIEFKHYDRITTQTVLSIKKDKKGIAALKIHKKSMYIHIPEKYFQKLEKEYEYKTENHSYKYVIKLEPETWKETLKEILDVIYK